MTKQTKSQEVAVVGKDSTGIEAMDQETAMQLADLQASGTSLINVRSDILQVARIKLVQKSSKSIDSGLGAPGDFTCDLRSANYGPFIDVVPIMASESASLLFSQANPPRKQLGMAARDGDILCRTEDLIRSVEGFKCEECPYGEYWKDWGPREAARAPGCKLSLDFTVLILSDGTVCEMNFRKSNYKAGRAMINFMANDKRRVPFGSVYRLKSVSRSKDKYSYFEVDPLKLDYRPLTNEELQKVLPTVKNVIAMEKAGSLKRETEVSDASDDLPI